MRVAAVAACLLALLAPAVGQAAAPQRGLSDGRLLGNADPAVRAAGIAVAQRAGAHFGRLQLSWSSIVDDEGFTRPSEADRPLSDPANAAYHWARVDAALTDLRAAQLTPMVYFLSAPRWAESAPRYPYAAAGSWAPRPADLAAFASAVARRYDGTYPDPARPGAVLPRVQYFQTWNEPNLARYLQPQWIGVDGEPHLFSTRWYRAMHAAAYAAIHARQPGAQVGLAGLAPTGDGADGTGRVAPMRFLRALLCVDGSARACGPRLPFDAIALHPLSVGDPDRPAGAADDLSVADLSPKLDAVLDRARRRGRLRPTKRPPLWITELNWTSAEAGGIPASKQAAVLGRAMMRLQHAGAAMVNWQFATDPPTSRTGGVARPAGLTAAAAGDARTVPGTPKPFAAAFRFPATAVAIGRRQAYVWGLPPAGTPASDSVVVERRHGRRWLRVARVALRGGVAARVIAVPRGTTVRLRTAAEASPGVRVELRLGLRARRARGAALRFAGTAERSRRAATARRAAVGPPLLDPRPVDPAGPGRFAPLPPLVPGGAPPQATGQPVPPIPGPTTPKRRLVFTGTAGGDVLIGTSGADRLIGLGGPDLLIGLGGDDRFVPRGGRNLVVRGTVVSRR